MREPVPRTCIAGLLCLNPALVDATSAKEAMIRHAQAEHKECGYERGEKRNLADCEPSRVCTRAGCRCGWGGHLKPLPLPVQAPDPVALIMPSSLLRVDAKMGQNGPKWLVSRSGWFKETTAGEPGYSRGHSRGSFSPETGLRGHAGTSLWPACRRPRRDKSSDQGSVIRDQSPLATKTKTSCPEGAQVEHPIR